MSEQKFIRAAAYARFSSDNQREESIEAQLNIIKNFAAQNGYEIVREYTDEAKSARTDNRPNFLAMIRDAEAGLFDAIIVHKLDRFSRDRYDFAFYRRILRKAGVQLISVVERFDDSPESVILESIIEGMAEYYSRNLAREVMEKGMLPNARACRHNGGRPPIGYRVNKDGYYEIEESEAEQIRLIFEMYARGEGYGAILDELARRGYLITRTGRPYSKSLLYDILNNEKYAGVYIYNRAASKNAEGKRNNRASKPSDEIIRIPGGMPAIVSRETWERVAERMRNNRHKGARNKAKRQYLLSGKLYCGKCGGAFVANTINSGKNKTEYSYYECSAKKRTRTCDMKAIGAQFIEDEVIKLLYSELFAPEAVNSVADEIVAYIQERDKGLSKRIKELEKQINTTEIEIRNIVDAVAKGISTDALLKRLQELEQYKADMQARLDDAKSKTDATSFTKEHIVAFLSSFQDILDAPFERKRLAIELFIDKVYVYENNFDADIVVPALRKLKESISKSEGKSSEAGVFGYEPLLVASTK